MRSTETVVLVSAPRVHERHTYSSRLGNNLATPVVYTTHLCREFNLNCYIDWPAESRQKYISPRLNNLATPNLSDSVRMVDIRRICLAIGTQNGAEISICGIEVYRLPIAECKLWCENI